MPYLSSSIRSHSHCRRALAPKVARRVVILDALLYAFDTKVDHRLLIRRLGVVAGNLQEGGEQLDFFTDYAAREVVAL